MPITQVNMFAMMLNKLVNSYPKDTPKKRKEILMRIGKVIMVEANRHAADILKKIKIIYFGTKRIGKNAG